MNEKQYALNIKRQLKQAIRQFDNQNDFMGTYVIKNLEDLTNNDIIINNLLIECEKLNIKTCYANKMKTNKSFWLNKWNTNNCLVFYL